MKQETPTPPLCEPHDPEPIPHTICCINEKHSLSLSLYKISYTFIVLSSCFHIENFLQGKYSLYFIQNEN